MRRSFHFWDRARSTTALPLTLPGQVKQRNRSPWRKRVPIALCLIGSAVLKAHMSTIVRIAIIIYLPQAVAGFAVGLTLPWLQFFKVI